MDEASISNIDLPIILAAVFILLSFLSFYARNLLKNLHPVIHTAIFCICISGLIFFLIDAAFIWFAHQNVDYRLYIPVSLVVGIVCFVILIKSGLYKELGSNKNEQTETRRVMVHRQFDLDNTLHHMQTFKVIIKRKELDLAHLLDKLQGKFALGTTETEIVDALRNVVPDAKPIESGYINPTTHNPCPFCGTTSERLGAYGSHKFTCPEHGVFDNFQIVEEIKVIAKKILEDLSVYQIIMPFRKLRTDWLGNKYEVDGYTLTDKGKGIAQSLSSNNTVNQSISKPISQSKQNTKHKKELQQLRESLSRAKLSAEALFKFLKSGAKFPDFLSSTKVNQVFDRAEGNYKLAIDQLNLENLRCKSKIGEAITEDLMSRLTRGELLIDQCTNVDHNLGNFGKELAENSQAIVDDLEYIISNWGQLGFYIQD